MNYDLIYKHFKLSDINYFGCQICDSSKENRDSSGYSIYLMVYKYNDDGAVHSLQIIKHVVNESEVKYSHEEAISIIYDKLSTLPVYPSHQFDKNSMSLEFNKGHYQISSTLVADKLGINIVKNRIAMMSRRGKGNVNLGKSMMYLGVSHLDRPIILLKDIATDKYAVYFHPYFENYVLNMDYIGV